MFYVYLWLRKDGSPYYVGKGQGKRAYVIHQSKSGRKYSPPKDKALIQILNARNEESAFETEKFLIKYYGRKDLGTGILRNMSDGGPNPPSRKGLKPPPLSVEKRLELSLKAKAQWANAEHRDKVSSVIKQQWSARLRLHYGREQKMSEEEARRSHNEANRRYKQRKKLALAA